MSACTKKPKIERTPINFGYRRVSTNRQHNSGLGEEDQENEIKRFYEYRLSKEYVWGETFGDDEGMSAKIPLLRRPAGTELDRRLQPGDSVTFAKLDRAWRSTLDCAVTVDRWKRRGVVVYFAKEGIEVREGNPMGMIWMYLVAVMAEWEREMISERQRAAYRARRARIAQGLGGTPGNKPAYGHKRCRNQWVPDDEELAVLELVLHLREVQGMSYARVAMTCWNRVKLRNCSWSNGWTVKKLVKRAQAMGLKPSLRYWSAAKNVPGSQRALISA